MARLSASDARQRLGNCRVPLGADFFRLDSAQVDALLASADSDGYRKPRNANGSRGRYYHERLQRAARRDDD